MKHLLELQIQFILSEEKEQFIWKGNLSILEKYFNYLEILCNRNYIEKQVILDFLNSFTSTKDTYPPNIEKVFAEVISNYVYEYFNLDELFNIDGGGVYYIFNNYGNCIYVGKSDKNLSTRALQSFTCKLPCQATYLKVLPIKDFDYISKVEAASIVELNPRYNQKKEELDMNIFVYSRLVSVIKNQLLKAKKIFPTFHKEN